MVLHLICCTKKNSPVPEKKSTPDQKTDPSQIFPTDSATGTMPGYIRPDYKGKAYFTLKNFKTFNMRGIRPGAYAIIDTNKKITKVDFNFETHSTYGSTTDTTISIRLSVYDIKPNLHVGKHYIGFGYTPGKGSYFANDVFVSIYIKGNSPFGYFGCIENNAVYQVITDYYIEILSIDYTKKVLSGKIWCDICKGSTNKSDTYYELTGEFTNIPFYNN